MNFITCQSFVKICGQPINRLILNMNLQLILLLGINFITHRFLFYFDWPYY